MTYLINLTRLVDRTVYQKECGARYKHRIWQYIFRLETGFPLCCDPTVKLLGACPYWSITYFTLSHHVCMEMTSKHTLLLIATAVYMLFMVVTYVYYACVCLCSNLSTVPTVVLSWVLARTDGTLPSPFLPPHTSLRKVQISFVSLLGVTIPQVLFCGAHLARHRNTFVIRIDYV